MVSPRLQRSRRLVPPDGDLDCWDRNIVGWRLSKTAVAKVAAATLEDALRSRKIDPAANALTLRSDNGFVFGAKPFLEIVRRYGLDQE